MSVTIARVTVAATATKLADGNCRRVEIFNTSATSFDVGGSGVTSGAGRPVAQNSSVVFEFDGDETSLYGITASGTASAAVTKYVRG